MRTKISIFFLILCLSVFISGIGRTPTALAAWSFGRTLSLGMSGEDVRALQRALNSDLLTRIQGDGPGSPGQETTYFGLLTQGAVIRFQEIHADLILKPVGLSSGTGFFGPSTMAFLNKMSDEATSVGSETAASISTTSVASSIAPTNPNYKNLDRFLASVDKVGKKQGISAKNLEPIKEQILKDAATSTDLRQAFFNALENNVSMASTTSPLAAAFKKLLAPIEAAFLPKTAKAQSGTPYGAMLLYSFYCTCNSNWLLTIEPFAPTYPVLLVYQMGTQAYPNYNLPYAIWFKGEYTPGAGQCTIIVGTGCATIPSEGLIGSMTGSSVP